MTLLCYYEFYNPNKAKRVICFIYIFLTNPTDAREKAIFKDNLIECYFSVVTTNKQSLKKLKYLSVKFYFIISISNNNILWFLPDNQLGANNRSQIKIEIMKLLQTET